MMELIARILLSPYYNAYASKTGWELGFYQGTKRDKPTLTISYCQTCGAKIESKSSRMFCDKCKYERIGRKSQ